MIITLAMVVFMITLMTLFHYLVPKEKHKDKRFTILFGVIWLSVGFHVMGNQDKWIDQIFANTNKPKQEFCGIIINEYKSKAYYYWEIANSDTVLTIKKPTKSQYGKDDDICISYVIDTKWQLLPYVFEIYRK